MIFRRLSRHVMHRALEPNVSFEARIAALFTRDRQPNRSTINELLNFGVPIRSQLQGVQ